MQDPILNKLKADAGIVLADFWRAFRHRPPVEEWWQARSGSPAVETEETRPAPPKPDGLCYFHLN